MPGGGFNCALDGGRKRRLAFLRIKRGRGRRRRWRRPQLARTWYGLRLRQGLRPERHDARHDGEPEHDANRARRRHIQAVAIAGAQGDIIQ